MIRGHEMSSLRLLLIALILVLGAFWVGSRYGPRQAQRVEATPGGEPAAHHRDRLHGDDGLHGDGGLHGDDGLHGVGNLRRRGGADGLQLKQRGSAFGQRDWKAVRAVAARARRCASS